MIMAPEGRMSDKPFCEHSSRRDFLFKTAITGGAFVGASLLGAPARASVKMPHSAVNYRDSPNGNQRCDNCALWQPPHSCKLVQDPIAASGWCVLYKHA